MNTLKTMFAEKQKLVAGLEVYGPGGKIVHAPEAEAAPAEVAPENEAADGEAGPTEETAQ